MLIRGRGNTMLPRPPLAIRLKKEAPTSPNLQWLFTPLPPSPVYRTVLVVRRDCSLLSHLLRNALYCFLKKQEHKILIFSSEYGKIILNRVSNPIPYWHGETGRQNGGDYMARNSVRTSRSMASKASRALRSGKTSKTTKSLAASTLSNRRPK